MNSTSIIFVILTIFLWGMAPLPEKIGLAKIDPFTGVFIRTTAVFACLLVSTVIMKYAVGKEVVSFSGVTTKAALLIASGGILASLCGQITFYWAIKNGSLSTVVPIASTYPLVTFVLSMLLLKEEFTWTKAGGVGLILSGIFLLSSGGVKE